MSHEHPPEEIGPVAALVRILDEADHAELLAALEQAEEEVLRPALRIFLLPRLAGLTPLQRHLKLFDRNGDGRLEWAETFSGFRHTGSGEAEALSTATNSHILMGFPSSGRLGDWNFSFDLMNRARHGADTGLFADDLTEEARNHKIDDLFARYDSDGDGRLTLPDLMRMVADNSDRDRRQRESGRLRRLLGRTASRLEFRALIERAGRPAADGASSVDRQDMRDLYDGYLMYFLLTPVRLAEAVLQARGLA